MISCKLKDICKLVKGKQIDTSLLAENLPFKYINGGVKESGYYEEYNTNENTIIISEGGASCGYVNYITEKFWLGCHCYKLIDVSVDSKYLFYALKANQQRIMELRTGAAMPNIKKAILNELPIKISMDETEQKQIVEKLDYIEHLLGIQNTILLFHDELTKSRFMEMFGDPIQNSLDWAVKSLFEMGYCKNGINFHTDDRGVKMYCLGVGDFKDNDVIDRVEELSTVSLSIYPSKECLLQDCDIVFVRSNGNKALVGRCLIVFPHDTPTTYSGFCIRYRLTSDEINPVFLLHVLKTDSVREMLRGRGASIQNLNQQILSSLRIPVPPIELQNEYVAYVRKIDKSKYDVILRIKLALFELIHSQKLFFVRC